MMIQIDVESGRVLQRLGGDRPWPKRSPKEESGFAPALQAVGDTFARETQLPPPEMLAPGDLDERLDRIQGLCYSANCL